MCFFPPVGIFYMVGINVYCLLLPIVPDYSIIPTIEQQFLPTSPEKIEQRSREVTVRVISDKNAASGILISKLRSNYLVLTNKHVLQSENNTKIGTFDGKLYPATLVKSVNFETTDLVLLSFQSSTLYSAAQLGRSRDLKIGDWVFSSGFPTRSQTWKFAEGQYTLSTSQPMEFGYAFGYNSEVEKGMSGGPVMDAYGRVIAVNGVHANPLWGKPSYRYASGEKPCEAMREEMANLSWAIPMETVMQFMPDLRAAPLDAVGRNENVVNPFTSNRPLPSFLKNRAKLISDCVVPPL
jgi:S1-C subfamily serine protease